MNKQSKRQITVAVLLGLEHPISPQEITARVNEKLILQGDEKLKRGRVSSIVNSILGVKGYKGEITTKRGGDKLFRIIKKVERGAAFEESDNIEINEDDNLLYRPTINPKEPNRAKRTKDVKNLVMLGYSFKKIMSYGYSLRDIFDHIDAERESTKGVGVVAQGKAPCKNTRSLKS